MTYRVRFHSLVARDLELIAQWITEYAGSEAPHRELAEIEQEIASLTRTPHRGSIHDEIAPKLRAIPAGRRTVIVFSVDDDVPTMQQYQLDHHTGQHSICAANDRHPSQSSVKDIRYYMNRDCRRAKSVSRRSR